MNSPDLKSAGWLSSYLAELSNELMNRNEWQLSEAVTRASRFEGGSTSEYLHEVKKVLKKIKTQCASVLTPAELADVSKVIEYIELAFKKIGGA